VLRQAGVDPSLVQFELTESLLMSDPEGAARTLRGLKDSGVKISVDDFGTGYSSLAYPSASRSTRSRSTTPSSAISPPTRRTR
jgi:EAL domain-containing protein (putative c-di-GMP-specific phosphodiesterase class I)